MEDEVVTGIHEAIRHLDRVQTERFAALVASQTETNRVVGEAAAALMLLAQAENRKSAAMEANLSFRQAVVLQLIKSRPFWAILALFALTLSFMLGMPSSWGDALLAKVPVVSVGVP